MRMAFAFLLGLLLFAAIRPTQAQSTCPAVVNDAVARLSQSCSRVGRNELCYGNVTLNVQPQAGITDLRFAAPGDREALTRVQSLTLSGMNPGVPEWGVAVMKLQANLPNSLPGQNVTVLLFGSVALAQAGGGATPMQAFTFASGINDAPCQEAPHSGLLIQTPKGSAEVELLVNGVRIWLNSTAYLQAQPGGALFVYLLEGRGRAAAFDGVSAIPAGTFVSVPLGGDGWAAGPPAAAAGYDAGIIARLAPWLRALPQRIAAAAPLDLSVCQAVASSNATTRQGPGTQYRRADTLRAGTYAPTAGATTGTDGARWYQLADGRWVREDAVSVAGPCGALPAVVAPPLASGGRGGGNYAIMFHTGTCEPPPQGIAAGDSLTVTFGCCGAATVEEQQAREAQAGTPSLIFDGVSVPLDITEITDVGVWFTRTARFYWTATPGTHTAAAVWGPGALTCTFTVP